jgi:DNA-binding LacI/PurR family transcriptional regulator
MAGLSRKKHAGNIYSAFLDRLQHLAGERAHEIFLRPLFQKVLKESRATVWVCADEKTARAALTFLQQQEIKVPAEISVVCFENWREAYERQLTTYDFNMNGMVGESLHLILDEKYRLGVPLIRELDGYVVERRTTRR